MATVSNIPNITSLSSLAAAVNSTVFLNQDGREGLFECISGIAPTDPQRGLYVPSTTAGFYWARVWDKINGKPEWFGAVSGGSGDPSILAARASANTTALAACILLCPVTVLERADYYIADTLWINQDYRTLRGAILGIEGGLPNGTRVIQTNAAKDVIRLGGTAPNDRRRIISVENICAQWSVDPVAPVNAADRINSPKAFHCTHVLAFQTVRCIAVDALIGHAFHDTINSRAIEAGCTRTRGLGANDFLVGLWPYGTAAQTGFAGANASLFIVNGNVTIGDPNLNFSIDSATGLYATADFADLFVDGLETSQVNFGIRLDGAGYTFAGGHGDVHLRKLVLDQCRGDGVQIRNTNALAKIHLDGAYIQVVSTGPVSNSGIHVDHGGGFLTIDNTQITGHGGNLSFGIFNDNYPNVIISDSVIVESVGYPVHFQNYVEGSSLQLSIGDGADNSGGSRAAISMIACQQCRVAPNIRGQAGAWSEGVNLIGTANNKIFIDPTRVDRTAIVNGRKVAINASNITAPGYYTSAGTSGLTGAGINVVGITM